MLYQLLKNLKSGTEAETNGRHILPPVGAFLCKAAAAPAVLDLGAGYGTDLLAVADAIKQSGSRPNLYAIESYPNAVEHLQGLGITVHACDIEKSKLPFDNETFDLVICNQVLEYTKEIFWIVSELARTTKVGGHLLIGVPNLGSLHNRVSLLFGSQPPAINVFGPHVRGYTARGLIDFLERGSVLRVKKTLGGNFYPFPPALSRPLSRALPSLAVSSFFVVERVNDGDFLSVFSTPQAAELVDTPYYRGQQI